MKWLRLTSPDGVRACFAVDAISGISIGTIKATTGMVYLRGERPGYEFVKDEETRRQLEPVFGRLPTYRESDGTW